MVIKGFFTNSVGIMVSRFFGLWRDILSASILGAGIFSDIFFVAFALPNFFRRIFGEGAFSQAFLPSYAKSSKKSLFSAEIFIKFLLFIGFLTLLVNIFTKELIGIIATGLSEQAKIDAVPFVQINFYYLILIYVVTFLASLLQYKGHFATTAFSTALLNISMIGALLMAQGLNQRDVALYLSFGVVLGGILQVLVHFIALRKFELNALFFGGIKKFLKRKRTQTKGFFTNFYHGLLGSSAMQISAFMDTWLASFLAAGSISYLFYANRIFQLPLAIFAIALSQALFPKITKQLKGGDEKAAMAQTQKSFELLGALLLLATIGGVVLAEPIIWLLFERGEFSRADTIECAAVLCAYLVGLAPFGLTKIFSLWLYARLRQKKAAKISIICLIFNLALALVLMRPLGAVGLALASSLGGILSLCFYIADFGFRNFLAIIRVKFWLIFAAFLAVFSVVLIYLKGIIDVYI